MKRQLAGLLLFAAGVAVGLMVEGRQPKRSLSLTERNEPFTVRRDGGKAVYLVPYTVTVDGRRVVDMPKGNGPMWLVHFNGARVQVAATEEADPR